MASSAKKKAELASPSASGVSARSRISSGAITVVEERKNCDRMVVADSIAIRTAAAPAGGLGLTTKAPSASQLLSRACGTADIHQDSMGAEASAFGQHLATEGHAGLGHLLPPGKAEPRLGATAACKFLT